jgi:nucleotide-binding universal stress UspA family protein
MPSNLLCATDGSKQAEKAIAYAVKQAKKSDASLTFLNVVTVSSERAARTYFWDQDILDASAAQVHKIMRAAMSAANKAKLSGATCVTVSGRDIAGAISAYAKKNGVDQIIMGSHGRRGAARLLLGSVAGSVAARASCPVTIVP